MAMPESVIESRKAVVEQLLHDMKTRQFSWTQLWVDNLSPQNGVTGRTYNGANRLHLAAQAVKKGFNDPRWATFSQIREKGWKLKKGSKASRIEFWKMKAFTKEDDLGLEMLYHRPICLGVFSVFNLSQVENCDPIAKKDASDFKDAQLFDVSDDFIKSSRCPVLEDDSKAYYLPAKDEVHLPHRFDFIGGEAFLRTLLHEQAHSTGSAKALNRQHGRFGSEEYAFEELVAELASAMTASRIGVSFDQTSVDPVYYESHVAYLQSWMKALNDDPNMLFKAAADASAASDYLLHRYKLIKAS